MSTAPPTRVIALDGPSGSGKSTVARGVARALGWRYVDTGATYRAATLAVLRAGIDLTDSSAVAQTVGRARIEVSVHPDREAVCLDGHDVSELIRGPAVTAAVSIVSAIPVVRTQLVALQRDLLAGGPREQGAVVEGRDIGTVVAPTAALKVYLDASARVRAARRAADRDTGLPDLPGDIVAAVATDLARRDELDSSRAASPLQAAEDAVHLDASSLTAEQVIEQVLSLAAAAGLRIPG